MSTAEISVETLEAARQAADRTRLAAQRTLAGLEVQLSDSEALVSVLGEGPEREQAQRHLETLRHKHRTATQEVQRAQHALEGMQRRLKAAKQLQAVRQREGLQATLAEHRRAFAESCANALPHCEELLRLRGEILKRGKQMVQAQTDLLEAEAILTPGQHTVGSDQLQKVDGSLLALTETAATWLRKGAEGRL